MLKSRDLVLAYIERLKIVNETVNGLTQNNTKALELAERCDEELANMTKDKRNELAKTKPLFGVPFTVKANIEVKGFITSRCNLYEMNSPPSEVEATVVTRGGEGVLVASAGSLFGIGNDIGGSVRIPAYMNGIFGLKPTSFPNHTIPVDGILPKFTDYQPASEMLTMGPLVRYASDLPLIMSAKLDISKLRLFYLEDLDVLISEGLHDEQRNVIRLVKNFFETKHQVKAQKVQFPLMNRAYELWGLTGFSDSTFVRIV
uniref:Amidase domain-containing protein n=1 Tax=Meloidogyne javanica TaxID=6303 RepID=A0A915LZK1_MELJA